MAISKIRVMKTNEGGVMMCLFYGTDDVMDVCGCVCVCVCVGARAPSL